MNPSDAQSVAFAAGREALRRIEEYLSRRESFAVETTLSSRASLALIKDARSRGYQTRLIFVAWKVLSGTSCVYATGQCAGDTSYRTRT